MRMYEKIRACRRRHRSFLSREGSTMVEVIIAFAVMMLMMAVFNGCIDAAKNLWMRSQDCISAGEEFNRLYTQLDTVKSSTTFDIETVGSEIKLTDRKTGAAYTLTGVNYNKYSLKDPADTEAGKLMIFRFDKESEPHE